MHLDSELLTARDWGEGGNVRVKGDLLSVQNHLGTLVPVVNFFVTIKP